jgi:hypothetical protein
MATEAQINSNLQNSRSSTGPRTASGKDASKRNSCRHGLAGSGDVVCPADRAKVEARAAALREEFRPGSEIERTLVEQMAVDSVRMDRCRESYLVLCQDQANRAALCWDEDRRAEAEEIASRLGRDPSRSRSRLEQNRHGSELLINRWEGLGRILRQGGTWDDSQRSLALDLLGVPTELRTGTTSVDPSGTLEAGAFRLGVVDGELERLRGRKAKAFDLLDEHDRESAEAGIAAELSKPLRLLERYESACFRRQQAALRILNDRPRSAEPVAPRPVAERRPAAPPPPAAPTRPAPTTSRPEPDDQVDWSARLRNLKPLSSMSLDELMDFYEIPAMDPTPTAPRSPNAAVPPARRT